MGNGIEECRNCGSLYDSDRWDAIRPGGWSCPYCFQKSGCNPNFTPEDQNIPPIHYEIQAAEKTAMERIEAIYNYHKETEEYKKKWEKLNGRLP